MITRFESFTTLSSGSVTTERRTRGSLFFSAQFLLSAAREAAGALPRLRPVVRKSV